MRNSPRYGNQFVRRKPLRTAKFGTVLWEQETWEWTAEDILIYGLESIIDLMLLSLSRPLSADASAISLEGSPL